MAPLTNIAEFEFGWIEHFQWMFEGLVEGAAKSWSEENETHYSRSHSCQSSSSYYTIATDEFEFCIRISDHEPVNCHSKVDVNINLMDYISVESDPDGFTEFDDWFVAADDAEEAIKNAASLFLEKINGNK